jgi:hypothetical protein
METYITVWIDSWQMQCCGTPFKIDDKIKWTALKWEFEKPVVDVGNIDFYYENHAESNDNLFDIEGIVSEIFAIHFVYKLNTETRVQIAISGKTVPVNEADGWDKDMSEEMQFSAYYVKLKNVSTKPI